MTGIYIVEISTPMQTVIFHDYAINYRVQHQETFIFFLRRCRRGRIYKHVTRQYCYVSLLTRPGYH